MKILGAKYRDVKQRSYSSSGAVFFSLAEHFLINGGVCYGASFISDGSVAHKRVENSNELLSLIGAKYSKSILGKNIFESIAKDILDRKKVLFSGTPCQIASVRNYLNYKGVNQDCIYYVQIVCHGVPNEKYWKKYLLEIGYKNGDTINFRVKQPRWDKYSVLIGKYKKVYYKDPYMFLFLNDYILLDSCYACKFKGESLSYDIVIGDFWGIKNICPSFYSNKGVSLVVLGDSKKTNYLLKIIKDSCEILECNDRQPLKYNPAFYYPAIKPNDLREIQLMIECNVSFKKIMKYIQKKKKNNAVNKVLKKLRIKK